MVPLLTFVALTSCTETATDLDWMSVEADGPDDTTLTVEGDGMCGSVVRAEAVEVDGGVRIELRARRRGCGEDGLPGFPTEEVDLEEPIGERPLLVGDEEDLQRCVAQESDDGGLRWLREDCEPRSPG